MGLLDTFTNFYDQLIYGNSGSGQGLPSAGEQGGQLGGSGGPPPGSPAPPWAGSNPQQLYGPGQAQNYPEPIAPPQGVPTPKRFDVWNTEKWGNMRPNLDSPGPAPADAAVPMKPPPMLGGPGGGIGSDYARTNGAPGVIPSPYGPQLPPPGGASPPLPPGYMPPQGGGSVPPHIPGNRFLSFMGMDTPEGRERMMAGLGAGLKSVGDNWNKPGLAAFAGSAGSALQGNQHQDTINKTYNLNRLNMAIRKRAADYNIPLAQARTDLLKRQASIGQAARAWWGHPIGIVGHVEEEARKYENTLRQSRKNEAGMPGVEDEIKKNVDDYKTNLYKRMGVNPDNVGKIKEKGYDGDPKHIKYLPPGTEFWDPSVVNSDGSKGAKRIRGQDESNTPITSTDAYIASTMGSPDPEGNASVASLTPQDMGVQGYADGGRPTPGEPALVGERGPEMFVPDQSGTVVPLPRPDPRPSQLERRDYGTQPVKTLISDSAAPVPPSMAGMTPLPRPDPRTPDFVLDAIRRAAPQGVENITPSQIIKLQRELGITTGRPPAPWQR